MRPKCNEISFSGSPICFMRSDWRTERAGLRKRVSGLWMGPEHFYCVCTSSWQFTVSGLMSEFLVNVKGRAFRDVTPCSVAERYGRSVVLTLHFDV